MKSNWEELVKEIMQVGFDVAMGGRYDWSEEWNRKHQEQEYDKAVAKYSTQIASELQHQREEIGKEFWEWYYEDETDELIEDAIVRITGLKDPREER